MASHRTARVRGGPRGDRDPDGTVEVTDAGLVVRRPVHADVHPWSAFDGYAVSADALVVSRSSRWRFDVRCDPGDVEDVAAAVEALGRFLPEKAG